MLVSSPALLTLLTKQRIPGPRADGGGVPVLAAGAGWLAALPSLSLGEHAALLASLLGDGVTARRIRHQRKTYDGY